MPVPWTEKFCPIPKVEHRGITIQQLRDLHAFIERLCKTRQLRDRDAPGAPPISIFSVNMYHIAKYIIKPAIEFQEEQRGTRLKYSWVEFVAREGKEAQQKPVVMFSHSWAGRFQDFMSAVNKLERSREFGGGVAIWICTFANSQFGENFGSGLESSPFFKAIGEVSEVVLVVDRDASSLQRIWCGFELYATKKNEKKLSIFTSMGQVGVRVTSGPLIEAIEAWDVTRMEASQATDRRQILNYLSGGVGCEREGLRTDQHGELVLKDGWRKELDDDEIVKECEGEAPVRQRPNGEREFAHEARLFKVHKRKFDDLNQAVRNEVVKAAERRQDPGDDQKERQRIDALAQRGITLGELRKCVLELKARAAVKESDKAWEDWKLCEVMKELLRPMIDEQWLGVSYAELVSNGKPRSPQYIVADVWKYGFHHTLCAIEWVAEALQMRDSAILYFMPFCLGTGGYGEDWEKHDECMRELIRNSYAWVAVLPDPKSPGDIIRSSYLQQLSLCFHFARPFYFSCKDGVLAGLKPFKATSWEFGDFNPQIAKILLDADWKGAEAKNKERKIAVEQQVESVLGLARLRCRLSNTAAGPVLRNAILDGEDISQVAAICQSAGLKINSSLLRGSLGETPLHIAAATGNVRAMELLLAAKADPNAEDHILETPLHYAAMSGNALSARVLLMHGAIADVESAFTESPLRLARHNPAAFLRQETHTVEDTQMVVDLLQAWEAAGKRHRTPVVQADDSRSEEGAASRPQSSDSEEADRPDESPMHSPKVPADPACGPPGRSVGRLRSSCSKVAP